MKNKYESLICADVPGLALGIPIDRAYKLIYDRLQELKAEIEKLKAEKSNEE